uniref:Uncharacterized protein n=1 Tax=Anser cygnoides TaxID=8845 RepID=A0A8B9EHS8_ANSCY
GSSTWSSPGCWSAAAVLEGGPLLAEPVLGAVGGGGGRAGSGAPSGAGPRRGSHELLDGARGGPRVPAAAHPVHGGRGAAAQRRLHLPQPAHHTRGRVFPLQAGCSLPQHQGARGQQEETPQPTSGAPGPAARRPSAAGDARCPQDCWWKAVCGFRRSPLGCPPLCGTGGAVRSVPAQPCPKAVRDRVLR